jgi:hypothetical protein
VIFDFKKLKNSLTPLFNTPEGSDRVARFYAGLGRKFGERMNYRVAEINGEPGLIQCVDNKLESIMSFVVSDHSCTFLLRRTIVANKNNNGESPWDKPKPHWQNSS